MGFARVEVSVEESEENENEIATALSANTLVHRTVVTNLFGTAPQGGSVPQNSFLCHGLRLRRSPFHRIWQGQVIGFGDRLPYLVRVRAKQNEIRGLV